MVTKALVAQVVTPLVDQDAAIEELWQWAKIHSPDLYAEHVIEEKQQQQWQREYQKWEASPEGKLTRKQMETWWKETNAEAELDALLSSVRKPLPRRVDWDLLGLNAANTYQKKDIRNAYRRKARKVHPDVGGDAEQFKQVYAAYRNLLKIAQ